VVITIDGPAGAGKSTVARALAERLGYRYVDTGSMYRELTAAARQHGVARDAVLEGRDTGIRVCPTADVKVYLVASLESRAARRAVDLGLDPAEVAETIAARDRHDSEQLAPAADAHVIDTSGLSVPDVVEQVLRLVEAAA
jgi:cytidylate kinase